jgi:hypothetical protein
MSPSMCRIYQSSSSVLPLHLTKEIPIAAVSGLFGPVTYGPESCCWLLSIKLFPFLVIMINYITSSATALLKLIIFVLK